MSRPLPPRSSPSSSFVRVNGKIRAREVRVVDAQGQQLGVMTLNDALNRARLEGVDLVEIAPNAVPPVCKIVDYGKYRYELAKRDKEAKKHQHANKVKEIQLTATIDPHDFGVKRDHAVDFLCEDMKVKISLRFRGREMAHQEFGFKTVNNFIQETAPYGHPDAPPKLMGRSITVMLSPLPRNKRAKNPRGENHVASKDPSHDAQEEKEEKQHAPKAAGSAPKPHVSTDAASQTPPNGFNNPFEKLDAGPEEAQAH